MVYCRGWEVGRGGAGAAGRLACAAAVSVLWGIFRLGLCVLGTLIQKIYSLRGSLKYPCFPRKLLWRRDMNPSIVGATSAALQVSVRRASKDYLQEPFRWRGVRENPPYPSWLLPGPTKSSGNNHYIIITSHLEHHY